MKKLICLCLAVACIAALAAGCQKNVNIGPTQPTTVPVNEEDISNAAGLLDGELDDAARKALEDALARGITIPASTQPPATMPPTMPAGSEIDAAEVRALMKKLLNTFASGSFMIKARGTSPMNGNTNIAAPMAIALDKEALAIETEMDWAGTFREQGQNAVMATINAGIAESTFGKKMRFLVKDNSISIVFPDKKNYLSMSDFGEEPVELDVKNFVGEAFGARSQEEIEKQLGMVTSSKVTVDGKEYLCATVKTDAAGNATAGAAESTSRYYFLNGELKRIEMQSAGNAMMIEIDTITDKVDKAMFSTEGMRVMAIDQITSLGSDFASLFGG